MKISCICDHCKTEFETEAGRVNRAKRAAAPLYCGKRCSGLGRRLKNPPTEAERKEAKRLYDAKYRTDKAEELKAKKREYFKRTYDPEVAAVERKKRLPKHLEYCRRPEYRAWKKEYDRAYRAGKEFGEFAEAFLLLQDINGEIEKRASRYDIYLTNGTLNKALMRRRSL